MAARRLNIYICNALLGLDWIYVWRFFVRRGGADLLLSAAAHVPKTHGLMSLPPSAIAAAGGQLQNSYGGRSFIS
jgi:hypothetical protein